VLSTSRRHFQIAFKMFDLNGDGTVDAGEFGMVTSLMRSHSATGSRHRDHQASTVKGVNSGLNAYFFGEDLGGELTVDRFLEFQRSLQEEILALEFRKKDEEGSGKIAEKEFADLLIAYAGFQVRARCWRCLWSDGDSAAEKEGEDAAPSAAGL
jgi:Ca2+-binding EF-hand superfamily protein